MATFISVGIDTLGWSIDVLNTSRRFDYSNPRTYSPNAYGLFNCNNCNREWSSHRFVVDITYSYNLSTKHLFVNLKCYGQKCDKCNSSNYIQGVLSNNDRLKVIWDRIYEKICTPNNLKCEKQDEKNKKTGPPHKSNLCEACTLGRCRCK